MASVFISHSARDNVQAERIRQSLKAAGFATVYLDFDPESGIPRGRKWEDELYSELRKADVVVFLSTAASVSSKWCHAELALARALGRPIVPVLLEPGAAHPLLEDTQWLRVEPGDAWGAQIRSLPANRAFRRVGPSLRTPRVHRDELSRPARRTVEGAASRTPRTRA